MTAQELEGLSPEDQFQRIAEGLNGITDESKRAEPANNCSWDYIFTDFLPCGATLGAFVNFAFSTADGVHLDLRVQFGGNFGFNEYRKTTAFGVGAGVMDCLDYLGGGHTLTISFQVPVGSPYCGTAGTCTVSL